MVWWLFFSYGIGNATAAQGDTIYVNGSSGQDNWDGQLATWNGTSGPKASIKNATGTVNNGGTVNIADGVYGGAQNTNITIYKSMNINGQSQDGTIINGTNMKGIFTILPGYDVTITDLTMCNGYTVRGGAAINCEGNLTVNNCNFEYNQASIGGAICTQCGSFLTINNCNFTRNNATFGGAIDNTGTLTVTGSNFTNNTSTANNGYCDGGAINSSGNLTVNNSNFDYNNAAYGGAIAIGNGCILIVNNSDFKDNTLQSPGGVGGAIFIDKYCNSTITNCKFINNCKNVFEGGAISNGGFLNVINCQFTNNTASFGGAIANFYYITYNATLNVYNSSFTGNNANMQGGAIFIDGGIGTFDSCDFIGNYATAGGAITNISILIINNCKFIGNNATNYGGALVNGNITNVTNSTFINNTAINGSIIYNRDPPNMNCAIIMNFNKFIGNTANYAIYNYYGIFDATFNWWGSNTGPLTGTIYGNVTTAPWLTVTANTSLNEGFYNTIQNITLTMNEPGTIYYTTNGTDPTTSSPVYSAPISISTTTILKYLALNLAGNKSPIYTQTYTIDTISPTASVNPIGGLYNTTKSVTLTMSKLGTIYYTTNGTDPTTSSSKYLKNLSITATTTLKYLAVDLAGNKSPTYTQTYTIDKVAPTAKANIIGGLYNKNQVVILSMSKNGTIYYTSNGTTPTTTSNKYTGSITISSTTTLKFIAVDTAGNKSPVYKQTYTIDKVAPKVSSIYPTNNANRVSLTAPITIKFNKTIIAGANYSKIYIKNMTTGLIVGITQSISVNTLTIKMTKSRLHGNTYQIYIPSASIKDKADNNLAVAYTFKFKTV